MGPVKFVNTKRRVVIVPTPGTEAETVDVSMEDKPQAGGGNELNGQKVSCAARDGRFAHNDINVTSNTRRASPTQRVGSVDVVMRGIWNVPRRIFNS